MAPRSGKDGKRGNSSRSTAKRIAGSKSYTAAGEPIRNMNAYVAAGGRPRNTRGDVIQNPTAYQNAIEASVRQNTNDPKYLYHYTTPTAAESISQSGAIQASGNGLDGPGTYCTAKPPRCKTDTLLDNNYASNSSSNRRGQSYVDNYVRMDADQLNARHVGGSRDVWKVDGNVDLNHHNAFVGDRQRHHHQNNYASHDDNRQHGEYHDTGDDCYDDDGMGYW